MAKGAWPKRRPRPGVYSRIPPGRAATRQSLAPLISGGGIVRVSKVHATIVGSGTLVAVSKVHATVVGFGAAAVARVSKVHATVTGQQGLDLSWCDVFKEIRLPTRWTFASEGGGNWRTLATQVRSGRTQRVGEWAEKLGRWTCLVRDDAEDVREFDAFFDVVNGGLHGFRIKDPRDFSTGAYTGKVLGAATALDMVLGTGDASQTQFQLAVQRTFGAEPAVNKTIYKPVAGTVLVAINGAAVTNFTVDLTTGVVTFTPRHSVTGTDISFVDVGAGDWKIRSTTTSWAGFNAGEAIRVSGSASNDTAVPDGVYTIVGPVPGGAGDLDVAETLVTEGAGATVTVDVHPAPRSADALTWGGQYDKPARFLEDHLSVRHIEGEGGTIQEFSIPLEELRQVDALSGA